jgi:hypothetical protein
MGEKRNAYRLLVGKPEGKRPLGRPRRRWVDNNRMDLGEVGWSDVDWIGLAQDRDRRRALVNSVLNLRVPSNAGKLSSGLSSSAQLHRVSLEPSELKIRILPPDHQGPPLPQRSHHPKSVIILLIQKTFFLYHKIDL